MYEIKRGAYPRGANLVGHLDYQTLQARFLEYEIKPRADLRRANLVGADLIGANLREADFYGADLTRISYNNKTKYDEGSSLDIYIKQNK